MLQPAIVRRWALACLIGSLILLAAPASPEPVVESARLNARLAQTPLAGLGDHFLVEGARIQNGLTLDPRLVVAIAGAESTFGAHICTPFNAWNWFWEGPCQPRRPDGSAPSPFSDWKRGIEVVSKFLKKGYLLKGYTTIPQSARSPAERVASTGSPTSRGSTLSSAGTSPTSPTHTTCRREARRNPSTPAPPPLPAPAPAPRLAPAAWCRPSPATRSLTRRATRTAHQLRRWRRRTACRSGYGRPYLAVAFAGLTGAAGFLLGRRTRR